MKLNPLVCTDGAINGAGIETYFAFGVRLEHSLWRLLPAATVTGAGIGAWRPDPIEFERHQGVRAPKTDANRLVSQVNPFDLQSVSLFANAQAVELRRSPLGWP